jgi:hypothetical protein
LGGRTRVGKRDTDRPPTTRRGAFALAARAVVHAAALAVAGLVVVAAGQPLFAEDSWWHLGMGEVYTASGPWLDADPFLFTAPGPPAPAAWLSDLALFGVERAFGFRGLRIAHALVAAAILAAAWWGLRRAGGSSEFASLGTELFAALAAYRLFQLRPDLFTILATLLLVGLLIREGELPSWRRVIAAAGLFALWANAHGGFVLGLGLLAAAPLGLALAGALQPAQRTRHLRRARRLAAALALACLASLANPTGIGSHRLYFDAGSETPELALVADEWAPVRLFQLPVPSLPPSPLAWGVVWCLLVLTPCVVLRHARARGRGETSPVAEPLDPALVAIAAASLAAMLSAVRLLWLGIFPLLVVARCARALGLLSPARRSWSGAAAVAATLLAAGFLRFGDWPMISQGIQPARYGEPYPAVKYDAHAVWFLRDAGLEGNLWSDYSSGNFLGFWLAPRMRVFVNGSLNVPSQVMEDRLAILERRGSRPGERFVDLLDRYRIDVFFGTGVPSLSPTARRELATTAHLERTTGWIPVFRNAGSAVYLRDDERNRANRQRVADHYAREGVPFDPERGFDPERVIRESLRWAVDHGLAPLGLATLEAAARELDPGRRRAAQERLASIHALLGLYEGSAAIDRRLLRADPGSIRGWRRLVWSLLHQGRGAEAREAAERLRVIAPADDGLSQLLVQSALRYETLAEDEAAALVALLPVFATPQLPGILAGFREPEARPRRP